MNGPIRRITRERTEVRTDAILRAAWLRNGRRDAGKRDGTWLTTRPPEATRVGSGPMLAMLGADAAANEALVRCAVSATRAYLLVGPGTADDFLHGREAPNVLVRRVQEVPTSALHTADEARLWIGGGLSLKLDATQAEALRHAFLRLFWHEATAETWLDAGKWAWQPARARPFDVPEAPTTACVHWAASDARLGFDLAGARVHLTGDDVPAAAPRRLWFRASSAHHARLEALARAGTDVVWDERDLPDLAVGETAGEVLLPGTLGRLRIRLTAPQAREVAALLDTEGAWRFHVDIRIGDPELRGVDIWLASEPTPRALEDEQVIDLPQIEANALRDVATREPPSVPAAQPLALSVRYRWPVLPPRMPAGGEDDPIVHRWRTLDDAWSKRLAAARDALEDANGARNVLGAAFARLGGEFLGFARAYDERAKELDALAATRPSAAGPADARALLRRLEAHESATKSHRGDIADTDRKARQQDEEARQRAEWEVQIGRAKHEATRLREEVDRESTRASALAGEAAETEVRSTQAAADERRDLDVKQKRIDDDRKANEKLLKKLRYDLEKHEKDASRTFSFTPAKLEAKTESNAKRFVPASAGIGSALTVPEDALPEVGALRVVKGQRYLVIETWEELDRGEQEASRLSAKLVAQEDA